MRETTNTNPYLPPAAVPDSDETLPRRDRKAPNPFIPAFIGIFTWGSSSPYALVLSMEQYLRVPVREVSWWVHIAVPLSIMGSIAWGYLSFQCGFLALEFFASGGHSNYGVVGLTIWIANVVFIVWTVWRIKAMRITRK